MVRLATLDDVDRMVMMGRRFLRSTRYDHVLSENPDQMRTLVRFLIEDPNSAAFVLERDEKKLAGMMAVVFVPQHPISGEPFASELFWWMEPEQRGGGMRLFFAAERWAQEKGAKDFHMIAPTDDVEKLYLKLGFARVEVLYMKKLAGKVA